MALTAALKVCGICYACPRQLERGHVLIHPVFVPGFTYMEHGSRYRIWASAMIVHRIFSRITDAIQGEHASLIFIVRLPYASQIPRTVLRTPERSHQWPGSGEATVDRIRTLL